MNPAPTLLDEWLTWPFVIGVVCVVVLVWLVLRWDAAGRELDRVLEEGPPEFTCPGHEYDEVDHHWVCSLCGDVVRMPLDCGGRHRYVPRGQSLTCTVCGRRTELPYDQTKETA